ncbi:MAG: DUF3626 domain-containing protein [Zoogloeaceae bacterium]|jgi:hypothetical protein|nr:DUF3626 domain-containing protein [Zoogloeaceae bacterium]
MAARIEASPQVQQELQSRGVGPEVGVFGDHKVQLGQGSPIRLDKIESAPVPFAGFTKTTRILSGKAGLEQSGGDALRQLTRPGGKLEAGKLLGDLKAVHTQLERLDALGKVREPKGEAVLRAYAPLVENLSNEELAAVYQSFTSAEMDVLQTALGHEGRANNSRDAKSAASDLFDLQALVLKEVSDRVARGEKMPGSEALPSLSATLGDPAVLSEVPDRHADHISSANMRVLVERGAQSATTREKMTEGFASDLAARRLPSMSARAVGDLLRAAPLTMNLDQDFLFGASSIMAAPDAQVENYHHLIRDGKPLPGGAGYIAPRDAVESLLFPELGAVGADNPDARPTYAALNVDRSERGAASSYGDAVIVFKTEVAQRATYTADDTFFAVPASVTQERRDNFYARLQALGEGKLPQSFLDDAAREGSPLRLGLEAFFDKTAATPDVNCSIFNALPKAVDASLTAACEAHAGSAGLDPDQSFHYGRDAGNYLRGELLGAFGDGEAARSRTATYDSLEALIPGMDTPTFNSLARAAVHARPGEPVGLQGVNYIEAQIQGGVVPSRDIAEIRVNANGFRNQAALADGRVKAAEFTRRTGIPVIFEQRMGDRSAIDAAISAADSFNPAHLRADRLAAAVDRLAGAPLPQLQSLTQTEDSLRDLPAGALEIRGNALTKAMGKFQALAEDLLAHPEKLPADTTRRNLTEEGLASVAFGQVFKPLLARKGALLRELDTLQFANAAQKQAFTDWVMSAQSLDSPQELRLIHENATRQAAVLGDLAGRTPPPSGEDMLRSFAAVIQAASPELSAYYDQRVAAGDEFGMEDKATEMSRISFMSLALLRHTEGGTEALSRLADLMTSPEQLRLAGQMERLASSGDGLSDVSGFDELASTSMLMMLTRDNVCHDTGRPAPRSQPFFGELSLLPQSTREAVRSFAPAMAEHLERAHPGYPAFPAPANPAALPQTEAGRRDFLVNHLDVYLGHEQTFELGRSTHGRGHIARAWIFAETMCNILQEQGIGVDRNAVLCGIAGHDMGRQGSGTDRWEGRSADLLAQTMRADFGAENLGEAYQHEIGASILAHGSHTLEGMLLNAADSLDIGRTQNFDPARFAFLQGRNGETPTSAARNLRDQLAREADLLERLTDPLSMHRQTLVHLDVARSETYSELERDQLTDQKWRIMDAAAEDYARHWSSPAEDYMSGIEDVIQLNPDLFPTFNRYYTRPMAAPA